MAQSKASKLYNTFVKGLNTDASQINYPENSTTEEANLRLLINGTRRRRLGIDYSDSAGSYPISGYTKEELVTTTVKTFKWFSVDNDSSRNYQVCQVGANLEFFDMGTTPYTHKTSYTINLNTYKAPNKTTDDVKKSVVEGDSVKGALFVCSSAINPISIKYNKTTGLLDVAEVKIKIRDVVGIDDGLQITEQPLTLSNEHRYNLRNQGWVTFRYPNIDEYATGYKSVIGKYPANNQQWFVGIESTGAGLVNVGMIAGTNFGSTLAPRGYYILDAFYKDRSAIRGISGLTPVVDNDRPDSLTMYSGRIWYVLNSDVYFTQIVKADLSNSGFCYQEGDPTSEDNNALVDTDGGVIPVTEAIGFKCIRPLGNALVLFAKNGVWTIQGNNNSGFKATEFQVTKVSDVGCLTKNSVIPFEGGIAWWSESGIYTLTLDSTLGSPKVQSMSQNTIETLYNELPTENKLNVRGSYDAGDKTISWLYQSKDNPLPYVKDSLLSFNLRLAAFYPYTLKTTASSPFIIDFVRTPEVSIVKNDIPIVVGSDVVTALGTDVTVPQASVSSIASTTKYLTCKPDGSLTLTVSDFTDTDFLDWKTELGGLDFESYLVTGYMNEGNVALDKQLQYLIFYFEQTETAWGGDEIEGYTTTSPSSCLFSTRWGWTSSDVGNKWSSEQQAYRISKAFSPTIPFLAFDNGQSLVVTKNRVRGRGKTLQIKLRSESGKDLVILGWHAVFTSTTRE